MSAVTETSPLLEHRQDEALGRGRDINVEAQQRTSKNDRERRLTGTITRAITLICSITFATWTAINIAVMHGPFNRSGYQDLLALFVAFTVSLSLLVLN